MIKKLISFILALCIINTLAATAFAQSNTETREYYNIQIKKPSTKYNGTTHLGDADFMVLTEGKTSKVYIKAEDLAALTRIDSKCPYTYNQTYTECAFVSSEVGHVIRFLFDSTSVMVFYACNDLIYEAPYDALYENGVAWVPFEFASRLFDIEAITYDDHIKISTQDYNALAVTNLVHQNIRDIGFDPVKELGITAAEDEMLKNEAVFLTTMNDLLSFEPTEWGMLLLAFVGVTTPYDEDYVEVISDSFLLPSGAEAEKAELFAAEKIADSEDILKKIEKSDKIADISLKTADGVSDAIKKITDEFPEFANLKSIKNALKLTSSSEGKKVLGDYLELFAKDGLNAAKTGTQIVGSLIEVINFLHFLSVYFNKSERSLAALRQYADNCDFDEKQIILDNCTSAEHPILGFIVDKVMREAEDLINDTVLLWLGVPGAVAKGVGIAWDFISQAGPIKAGIDFSKSRLVTEYAIKYQDDSFGMYYKYYGDCLEGDSTTHEELDKMLNSLYAYMKFSFIARNSMADAIRYTEANAKDNDSKTIISVTVEALSRSNEPIAEYLTYMEQDIFTPDDAKALRTSIEKIDNSFAKALREHGTPLDKPTQNTTPVFEFPKFPGAKELEYITEEEAIELAKRTVTKLSGGLLESGIISSMIYEMTGSTELFTYTSLGGYFVDGKPEAFIVDVSSDGVSQMLLFVSLIGNEVWLGTPSQSSPGGYYVYKELDLLHADRGDFIKAIGSLAGKLFEAY